MKGFEAYSWEPSNAQLARETGLDERQMRRFDTNTSPYTPREWLKILADELDEIEVNQYPDTSYTNFRESLSKYVSLGPQHFVITNGADEALDISVKTFIDSGSVGIVSTPSYSYFRVAVELLGGKVARVSRGVGFQDDTDEIIDEASKEARIILLCSPNNPTGTILNRKDLIRILNESNSAVVVDEAYYEFADQTVADLVEKYDNLVVIRTFSKAFSLASVRVGYMIASEKTTKLLNMVRPPNSLSSISLTLAELALGHVDTMKGWVKEIIKERKRCADYLSDLQGVEVYPTETNFVLMRLVDSDASSVHRKLLEKGLVVRALTGDPMIEGFLRFSVGLKEDNNKLLSALTVLSQN